jgi:DNA-binding LacI/PurR family transcriptional regulator
MAHSGKVAQSEAVLAAEGATAEKADAPTGGRVTAAAIARRVALSRATVAGVLSGQAERMRIHPDTRKRVLAAAEEMGYRPDAAARAMRTGKYANVGFLQPENRVYLPHSLLDGMMTALDAEGLHLTVARVPDAALSTQRYLPRVLSELRVDGLLVNHLVEIAPHVREAMERYRVPVVWLNNKLPADCVYPDDYAGARDATRHLLALGHTRIVYLYRPWDDGADVHYSVTDRRAGYEAALREAGLAPRALRLGDAENHGAARVSHALALLAGDDRPTAILTYERDVALPVAFAALRLGLSVPRDLSLMEFHFHHDWESGLKITSVITPFEEVGARAVQMLLKKMERPEEPLPPVTVPLQMRLDFGETLAPPPR